MITKILTVLGLLLSCAIGVWKFFSRKNEVRRKVIEEAGEDLDNAHENKDKSSLLDAWDKSNRV